MKSTIIASVICGLIAAVSGCSRGGDALPAVNQPSFDDIALADLIGSGNRYDGALVRTKGWCRIEFESNALYLTAVDREERHSSKAIWLNVGSPVADVIATLNGQYVMIEGKYDTSTFDGLGGYPGMITDIKKLERANELGERSRRY